MAMQNVSLPDDNNVPVGDSNDITIKQETHNFELNENVQIKTELHFNEYNVPIDNPFENIQLQVKQEYTASPTVEKHTPYEINYNDFSITIEKDNECENEATDSFFETEVEKSKHKIQDERITNMYDDNLVIKQEEELGDLHDYSNFDDAHSMDSNEAKALNNVEACLQDETKIKCESDLFEASYQNQEISIKDEIGLTVTETHLISNKLINTTSTVTNPQDGLTKSQTTKTLVMEILPMTHTGCMSLGKIENPEEILPTTYTNEKCTPMECDYAYQLNSITGNVMSLEQEAYGLLKAKRKMDRLDRPFVCNKCPKAYKTAHCLKKHMNVHESIEKRAMGIIKGQKTRIANMKKKLKEVEETYTDKVKAETTISRVKRESCSSAVRDDTLRHRLRNKTSVLKVKDKSYRPRIRNKTDMSVVKDETFTSNVEIENKIENVSSLDENVKKEGYECTCGKVFRRRSRMETCLRSHNMCSEDTMYLPCHTCSKQFKDKEELLLHRKRLHRKRFPCKFCPTDYNTRKELFKHLQIHQKVQVMEYKVLSEVVKGKQKLKCFMCAETYSELSELKSHVMDDHKEPYVCPHCSHTFSKIIDFGNHTKTDHPEVEGQSVLDVLEAFSKLIKAWKCEECDVQFHEADKLALHQIEKHSPDLKMEPQFQCMDCRRVFISQKGLTSHRRIHHSTEVSDDTELVDKGVMCIECRKICKDANALSSHMRLHSLERKYPCKFCDFRFATPEKRKAHAELHTGDMKYVCFICEYQCSSENRLKHHKMSVKHLNMKEFLATGKPLIEEEHSTSKKTKTEDSLEKEEWVVVKENGEEEDSGEASSPNAAEESTCDVCGKKFTSESKMLRHKNTHPFIEIPNDDKPTRIFFK